MPPRRVATLAGMLAIAMWSSLALLTTVTANLPPFQVLALCFGFAVVGGSLWLTGRRRGFSVLRQPLPAFLLSLVALFAYHALYLMAFRLAPVVEVNLINYLWPALIVLFAALLPGGRLRAVDVIGCALAFLGVLLLVTQARALAFTPGAAMGYLAALTAAVIWAAYSVLNRRYAGVPSAAIIGPCAAVAILAAIVHLVREDSIAPTTGQWIALGAMGLGPTGLAFLLWDRGTKAGDLPLLGTLSYAAPVLSTLSLLALGRGSAHWTQAAAIGLLIAGVAVAARGRTRETDSSVGEFKFAASKTDESP